MKVKKSNPKKISKKANIIRHRKKNMPGNSDVRKESK